LKNRQPLGIVMTLSSLRISLRRNLWLFMGLSVVGLLIWGRLRYQHNVPRTALAEPEQAAVQEVVATPPPETPAAK
jgi:hypothetical protein